MGFYFNSDSLTPSKGSGGGSSGKYKLLDRVKDDSNNDIGAVCGFYTDANGVEYAVVCLNAEYRLESGQWGASISNVTNMPLNGTINTAAFGIGTETATTNGDLILAFTTSTGVSHCRSKSFMIAGTTYYGQMPNICELIQMFAQHHSIYVNDPTASISGSSLNFSSWKTTWSSTQCANGEGWYVGSTGNISHYTKTNSYLIAPILEVPNN